MVIPRETYRVFSTILLLFVGLLNITSKSWMFFASFPLNFSGRNVVIRRGRSADLLILPAWSRFTPWCVSVVEIISRHFCVFKSNKKRLQRVPEPPLVWPAPLIIDLPSHPSHQGFGTADPPLFIFLSCRGATRQRDQYLYGEGAGSGQRDECATEVHLHVHSASVSPVGGSVLELQALKFWTGWVGVYRLSLWPLPRALVSSLF